MPSLIDMKKKRVIIGAIIGTTAALFLFVTAVEVPSVNASNNNCVNIDCLKKKLRQEKRYGITYLLKHT